MYCKYATIKYGLLQTPIQAMSILQHLGFHRATPCPALAGYIDSYWFINRQLQKSYSEFLHPDGGMGIILNYGSNLSVDQKTLKEGCFFDGTNTKTRVIGLSGDISAIGIRFKPAATYAFISAPLHELKNKNTALSDIGKNTFSDLHCLLGESKNIKEKIKLLNIFMINNFHIDRKISSETSSALLRIKMCRGTLSINELSEQLGINKRKLERLFNLQLGMTPFEYSRNIRVQYARMCLKQKHIDYNEISHRLDYFDQSHFIKQFKFVVGITPGQYKQRYIGL
ncbi:hypothetical protein MNBD_GAMMA09-3529 [hydrothermal vent metagenome]|uniref:HTH araC/xylS-type domain-containing protein n=1 Tax=hydrothermal vent metagenome TaxID=652676 RepID=A0A3B0YIU1_9ZZZZ